MKPREYLISFRPPSGENYLDLFWQRINKIVIPRTGARLSKRTVDVYVSTTGSDGSWTKVEGTMLLAAQEGITIQFESPVDAQYVKLHSVWDERDVENSAIDNHTIAGTPAQLIEVYSTVNGQTTSWTYDSLGNRISENRYRGSSSTVDHEYYENSSLLKKRGDWAFNYDANENLIERGIAGTWNESLRRFTWSASAGELWTYAYDLKNRLVEVKYGNAGTVSLKNVAAYTYDSRDLRVMTVKAGATTYYQYDQAGDLVWTESGAATTKYVQALGQVWAEIRTESSASATYYHHSDHLGSTELITDAAGAVVWSASYEAFGAVTRSNGTASFTPRFTGKQLDADTGLYYFNARWYDPQLGRFITEDPARDGENWVGYCENSPLVMIDPSGLDPFKLDGAEQNVTGMPGLILDLNEFAQQGVANAKAVQQQGPIGYALGFTPALVWGAVDFTLGDDYDSVINDTMGAALLGGASREIGAAANYLGARAKGVIGKALGSKIDDIGKAAGNGERIVSQGGVITIFEQEADQVYYRVFSGDKTQGSWLTAVKPKSSALAQEALSLPPGNKANLVQEVLVPKGTMLERSRAAPVPEWGRLRGGAEQFELLTRIPKANFGPGVPLR